MDQIKDAGLRVMDAGLDAINACSGVRDGERRVRDAEPWSEDPMVEVQLASNSKSGKVPSASIIVLNIGILKMEPLRALEPVARAEGQTTRERANAAPWKEVWFRTPVILGNANLPPTYEGELVRY